MIFQALDLNSDKELTYNNGTAVKVDSRWALDFVINNDQGPESFVFRYAQGHSRSHL